MRTRNGLGTMGLGFAVVFIAAGQVASANTRAARPNILFIMSDDHTAQAWGVYGGVLKEHAHTPNIHRLAKEGCLLQSTFCTNSICVPSRASIMTGQYSHRNGVYTLSDALSPDRMNIAKVMQQAGYQTAIIGKWHLKQRPSGFDYFNVLPGQGRYKNPLLRNADSWEQQKKRGKEYPGFSADVIVRLTIDWLKGRDKTKPFLMMCHFKATHGPFDYPERFAHLYKDVQIPAPASLYDRGPQTTGRCFKGQVLEENARRIMAPNAAKRGYPGLPWSIDGLPFKEGRMKAYQKLVKDFMRSGAAMDDNIGKLLAYLDDAGLAANTVVIHTADQGYFLGEHGFFDKRLMYEQSLRMPMVVRYPGEIPAGSTNNDIILNIDFPSLIADYAGVKPPPSMQGRSFRANLAGRTPDDWRQRMYYRYWQGSPERPGHFGIRDGRYKLIFFYGLHTNTDTTPAWEFFDLQEDPDELHNAYADAEYQPIIAKMKIQLKQLRQDLGDTDADHPAMLEMMKKHWD